MPFVYLDIDQALTNVGDPDGLADMLRMLQNLLVTDLPQIGQWMDQQDFPSANSALHALKGCLPIFCEPTLCAELTAVELLSKSAAPQGSAASFVALRPKLEVLCGEIESYLGSAAI